MNAVVDGTEHDLPARALQLKSDDTGAQFLVGGA
jgi:hypothetical protein